MTPPVIAKADHVGARRDQQDRVAVFSDPEAQTHLLVFSDGVGGQEYGALASQAVVDTAEKLWRANHRGQAPQREFLSRLCQEAHEEILRIGRKLESGPRATIVAL